MKDIKILTEEHLRSLLYSGVLRHDKSDDSYNIRYEYCDDKFRQCWFTEGMKHFLGSTVSAEEFDDTTWHVNGWHITAWMLEDNYRRLMEMSYDRRFPLDAYGKRHIKIMTKEHLAYLASAGHIEKRDENDYADYKNWFGGFSMPDAMYFQLCGVEAECIDVWTPSRHFRTLDRNGNGYWAISDWMIDDNFERIFNEDQHYDEEEDEYEDEEDEVQCRQEVTLVGDIVDIMEECVLLDINGLTVLVKTEECADYSKGDTVRVWGKLCRVSNMMCYPEVIADTIEEA